MRWNVIPAHWPIFRCTKWWTVRNPLQTTTKKNSFVVFWRGVHCVPDLRLFFRLKIFLPPCAGGFELSAINSPPIRWSVEWKSAPPLLSKKKQTHCDHIVSDIVTLMRIDGRFFNFWSRICRLLLTKYFISEWHFFFFGGWTFGSDQQRRVYRYGNPVLEESLNWLWYNLIGKLKKLLLAAE